ncbi:MAG TPA: DUF6519 domain-containing protein, partial [Thermoanaerobaculia bacterium]|nr:DUF6519 domain-containing protein [Thermoanaerobaculia bacterium]
MKGDFTRSTFDRRKRYASVRMQQGRVQIDADWNEQADVESHLHETAIGAILGPGAAPAAGGGFAVTVAPGGGDLLLGDGLLWVDGILCELGPGAEAAVAAFPGADEVEIAAGELEAGEIVAGDWIEIRHDGLGDGEDGDLARVTNVSADGRRFELDRDVTDPGEDASPRLRRRVSLASQRDLPAAAGETEPLEAGGHLVYADVWRWHVTALEDPEIRESALGGPDTATRLRTVCQVKLLPLGEGEVDDAGNLDPGAFDCGGELPGWDDLTAPPSGRLRARTRPETDPDDPCVVPSGGGYAGLENQLYRVEVHDGGVLGGDESEAPTFKWSRDNATVVTDWLGVDGAELRVRSVGRDQTLSFHGARWVELTDDGRELRGEPGVLVRLLKVIDDEHLEIDRDDLDLGDFPHHPKVRRWDLPDSADGALAVERPGDNDGYLSIEQGIEVRFEDGSYRSGDHWWIPARAFVGERQGEIEWPRDAAASPLAQAPHGVEHHYLRLALVTHDGEVFDEASETDCRDPFCTLPDACREHAEGGGCCTVSVGDGGDVATVQEAIERLPEAGGVVCIHPGTHRGAVRIEGRQGITLHGCGGRPRLTVGGDG